MSAQPKPTAAQRRVLENMAAGRDPAAHLKLRCEYGGFLATFRVINRRGWVDADGITDAGRAAIAKSSEADGKGIAP